jgi:hypothetical protein
MEDFPQSIATQLIDKHVRQHRQLKLSDQSDVVIIINFEYLHLKSFFLIGIFSNGFCLEK